MNFRNVPDLAIQGPSGENTTLESVDKLVGCILTQNPGSTQESTAKAKRKEYKEAGVTEEEHVTQQSHSSPKKVKNSEKKKKKRTHDSVTNGLLNGHHEEAEEKTPEVRTVFVVE